MAKKNVKVTMDEATIVGIKRLAKERGTSVSSMMTAHMVETLEKWDREKVRGE
jgi:uncharacterized membrane-anchored protein YjiN (DUF445 family)